MWEEEEMLMARQIWKVLVIRAANIAWRTWKAALITTSTNSWKETREKKKYKQQQNANIRVSFKHWYLPENKFSPLTATGRVAGFLLQPMNVLLSVSYEAKVYETNEVAAKVQLPCRYQPRRWEKRRSVREHWIMLTWVHTQQTRI